MDKPVFHSCRYLCLAGAGTKCPAYLGMLEGLERYGDQLFGQSWSAWTREVMQGACGSSAGALAALSLILNISTDDIRKLLVSFVNDLWKHFDIDLAHLPDTYGIDDGESLRKFVTAVMRTGGLSESTTFECMHRLTRREFMCTATNVNKHTACTFSASQTPTVSVIDAVCASMSVPLLFKPVNIGGDLYVDGALSNNVPADYFDVSKTLVFKVPKPRHVEIAGLVDYISGIVTIGIAAQTPPESAFVIESLTTDKLDAVGVDIYQSEITTDAFISCGYAAIVNRITPIVHATGYIVYLVTRLVIASSESAYAIGRDS